MFKRSQIINGVTVFLIGTAIIWIARRAASASPGISANPAAAPGGDGPNFAPSANPSEDVIEV